MGRELGGRGRWRNPEKSARDLAGLDDLLGEVACEIDGDRETHPCKAAVRPRMAVLVPTNRPSLSINAPPELPMLASWSTGAEARNEFGFG